MRTKRLNSSGMTLVELLVSMTVMVLVVTVILGFMVDSIRESAIQTKRENLLTNAHIGLDKVANDIRLSANADDHNRWLDANAPSAPTDLYSWQSDTDTLVLASSAENTTGSIIFDDPLDYITIKNNIVYYLSSHTLYRRTIAAAVSGNKAKTTCPPSSATASCPADFAVLDNVSSFSIKYLNGDDQEVAPSDARSVQISVSLLDSTFGTNITATYKTRMVFRNG
jgi:type II secretory pathway pseudopilin PulG